MVGPPQQPPCGVSDYMHYVAEGLLRHAEVAYLCAPGEFNAAHNRVDIVHLQHQYFVFGGLAPWRADFQRFASRITAPAVMTVHEIVEPQGPPLKRLALRWTNRAHFLHSAFRRLLVHTDCDGERLKRMGISARRIRLVRHGVPKPPALPDSADAKSALGLEDRFVVTLFGFLSRKKGHPLAIDAMRKLPKDVILLIAGGRHPSDASLYAEEIERIAQDAALAGRVQVTGYLQTEEVHRVMAATDVVIAPFIQSSGSGSLAMAFACGKPVIASNIPPHREFESESPGLLQLFPQGDSERLAMAIEKLRDSPEEAAAFGERSAEYARTHSYERIGERLAEVYREALG